MDLVVDEASLMVFDERATRSNEAGVWSVGPAALSCERVFFSIPWQMLHVRWMGRPVAFRVTMRPGCPSTRCTEGRSECF